MSDTGPVQPTDPAIPGDEPSGTTTPAAADPSTSYAPPADPAASYAAPAAADPASSFPPPPAADPTASYAPPAYAPVAAGGEQPLSPSDERLWATLAHLTIFVLGLIGPVLILVLLGKRSAFVADQAKEALNFHITVLIAELVSILLMFVLVGFVTFIVVGIGALVLGVMAAIKANSGEAYRYPLTLRVVS